MDSHIRLLAKEYLRQQMMRVQPRALQPSDGTYMALSPDGRKRRGVINSLARDGYLKDGVITSKAYDECPATPPQLLACYETFERNLEHRGVPLRELPLEQQKYIWENRTAYMFYAVRNSQASSPVGLDTAWREDLSNLLVADEELTKHIDAQRFSTRLKEVSRRNVPWGLQKLGLLTEEAASKLTVRDASPFGDSLHLAPPDKIPWDTAVPQLIDRLAARMRGDLSLMAMLTTLQATVVVQYGGDWNKVWAAYEALISAELKTQKST